MNRPDRAGIAVSAVMSAVVLPAALAPAAVVLPAALAPATIVLPAVRPPAAADSPGPVPPARPAGVWQLVAADHYGGPSNASGYSAVVTAGRHDAWVFGGTDPGATSSGPVAKHWDGRRWRAVGLPGDLGSFISAAGASSPANVWAVSSFGGYALRFNGNRWSVARRWQPGPDATCVTAISPTDVWLFGAAGPGPDGAVAWNFNGHAWARVAGPRQPVYRASAVSRRDIWAITAAPRGGLVEHWNGVGWKQVATGSALAGTQLDDVLAVSRNSVWVLGNSPAATPAGRVVLARWNGTKWRRFAAPGLARPRRIASDGRGGIWVAATTLGAETESRLLHLSRSGRWTQIDIAHGLGNGISDLALIPGTQSLWGSGGFLTQAGGDAAIWLLRNGRTSDRR